MKTFSKLALAGCLLLAAPLVQACGLKHDGGKCIHDKCMQGMGMSGMMDKNGDGAIGKKEFDAFHAERFKEMDANKDGKITKDEMDAMHNKMMEGARGRFESRFDESDINHDGALGKDEAEIGMPMLFSHFDEVDSNKDGKVSKEEMAEHMKKMQGNMPEKCDVKGKGMMKHHHH